MRPIFMMTVLLLALALGLPAQTTLQVPSQFSSIQGALVAASSGDTIEVAAGIYNENINFLGKAVTLRSLNGAAATSISGSFNGPCVAFVSGEGPGSVLQGFTLTQGSGALLYTGPNGPVTAGGGLYCLASSPTIRQCRFLGNMATRGGGAEVSGSPALLDCFFDSNTATGSGGALSCLPSGFPVVANCVFANNTSQLYGGAISCANGAWLTLVNDLIYGNTLMPASQSTVSVRGSAVFLQGASSYLILEGCTVTDNDGQGAAAIESDGSLGGVTISNSILWANAGSSLAAPGGVAQVSHAIVDGGYAGTAVSAQNPQFVDPSGGDYHLGAGSAALNAGLAGSPWAAQLDLEGRQRVLYGTPDLGPFEQDDLYASPAAAGNLGLGSGGPWAVLSINGQTGGADRRVHSQIGQSNTMAMAHPPSNPVPSHFAVYGFFGVPGPSDTTTLPLGIGDMVMLPCPMYPWGQPLLFTFTNSTGVGVCGQLLPSHPTPWSSGPQVAVYFPLTVTFQGVVEETTGTFRVTNAIVLVID